MGYIWVKHDQNPPMGSPDIVVYNEIPVNGMDGWMDGQPKNIMPPAPLRARASEG